MPKKADPAVKRAREQHVKNLERALKEERTGLVALARAFLEESPDPNALVRRVEGMVRQAERAGAPLKTRDAIRFGHSILTRAAEQLQGRPQTLFDPDVGHVPPAKAEVLSRPPEAEQLGLGITERNSVADVETERQERARSAAEVRSALLRLFQESGPMSDQDMVAAYLRSGRKLSPVVLKANRRELSRLGRLVKDGTAANGDPRWMLLEGLS